MIAVGNTQSKVHELQRGLRALGKRLAAGDESQLFIWAIPGELACTHRPLRHHPRFGGSRRNLPNAASTALVQWVDRVLEAGFRSIISLMHPKEIAHYAALDLGASDLLGFYKAKGLEVCSIPWDDPAHRPEDDRSNFKEELVRIQVEALRCFQRLPKAVLLHCSAGIDRSSPVAAFIWSQSQL